MAAVEHHDPELFDGAGAVLGQEVGGQLPRRPEPRALTAAPHQGSPSEFHGSQDLGRARATDAADPPELTRARAGQPVSAADVFDQTIREVQRVDGSCATSDDEGQQLVVAEPARSQSFELLAWSIVAADTFHLIYTRLFMRVPTWVASRRAWIVLPILAVACATPPIQEMNQAQGAIDAARAVGAERYAPGELGAAIEALERASEAVDARDYRLALSDALESREQAQHAAVVAAETRARLRGDLSRALAEVVALVSRTRERERIDAEVTQALDALEQHVQETSAMIEREEYEAARRRLAEIKARLAALIEALGAAQALRSPR
jgi:hypothetical protein